MCAAYLRPGSRVPLEARPLEAGVLLLRLLAAPARFIAQGLELSSADADTQDDPPLHAAPAGCVTLEVRAGLPYRTICLRARTNERRGRPRTFSQSWLSQCGAQSLSPQG